jgi:hypothetical protein
LCCAAGAICSCHACVSVVLAVQQQQQQLDTSMAGTTQEVFWLGERIQMARSWCVVAAHNKTKKKKQQMLLSSDVGSYGLRSSAPINYYPTELVRRKQSDKSSFSSSSKLRLRMMSSTSRHHQPTSAAMLGTEKNLLQSKISGGVQEGHKAAAQRVALRVALICGGPSAERGISLNSARSVLDHLKVLGLLACFFCS